MIKIEAGFFTQIIGILNKILGLNVKVKLIHFSIQSMKKYVVILFVIGKKI